MSKALVIKGADFSANKLDTVIIGEIIPCTGLTLSDSTFAFTSIGQTKQLTATTVPENTTDTIEWSSSDETRFTVENGLITCIGVGSATITATCGNQTATCAVTASVTVDANTALSYIDEYALTSTDLENNKDYASIYTGTKYRTYDNGENNVLQGYQIYMADSAIHPNYGRYPIEVPNGTEQIIITFPSGFDRTNPCTCIFVDAAERETYDMRFTSSKALTNVLSKTRVNNTVTINIPDVEAEKLGFAFTLGVNDGSSSAVTGDVTVVFS